MLRFIEGDCVGEEASPWLPSKQGSVAIKWANSGIVCLGAHLEDGENHFREQALEKELCSTEPAAIGLFYRDCTEEGNT